jgi:olefin beta-lactone synthetase
VDANANVARHLRQHARERPLAAAIRTPVSVGPGGEVAHHTLGFGELDPLTDAAARIFRRAGIRPGTRTLLALNPGEPLVVGLYGLLKAGAVPVLIDPGMGFRAALACVERTRPQALVGTLKATLLSRLPLRALGSLAVRVTLGTGTLRRELARARHGEADPLHAAGPDDLAAILFTSGSTGSPKGVRYTHGMLEAQLGLIRSTFGMGCGDIDLPLLPAFSAFNPALGVTTVTPLINPAKPAACDPMPLLEAIRGEKVTTSFGSPTLWDILARAAEVRRLTLPSLRLILTAGAPVPPGLVARLARVAPNATVHTPYGATECLPVSSVTGAEILRETGEAARLGRGTCVGRPVGGVRIRVVREHDGPLSSPDSAEGCASGEVGEVLVTGPTVTREYDHLPEATRLAKCVDAQGCTWHRMGDLGTLDAKGRLWFHGRRVEALRTSQGRLTTESVEPSFADHPAVARCALVGIGPRGRQEAALVVQPRRMPARDIEARNLAAELRHHAAANPLSLRVRWVVFQASLPVDVRHNAKVHRLRLAAHWTARAPLREADTDGRERWGR